MNPTNLHHNHSTTKPESKPKPKSTTNKAIVPKSKHSTLQCTHTLYPTQTQTTTIPKPNQHPLLSLLHTQTQTNTNTINDCPAWKCDWNHNGTLLAVCYGVPNPCVRIWKIQSNTTQTTHSPEGKNDDEWFVCATLRPDPKEGIHRTIRSVTFAPNRSDLLATASFDGVVTVWEDCSSLSPPLPNPPSSSNHDEYEPTDSKVGTTSNGWEPTLQLEGHESEVKDVVWNSNGTLLASCGRDKTVWVWEMIMPLSMSMGDGKEQGGGGSGGSGGELECECVAVLEGHTQDVKVVLFGWSHGLWGDGDEILLSGSYDNTIRLWAEDAGEWYCALTLSSSSSSSSLIPSSTIWSLALSPGHARMLSGGADGDLLVWRCCTGQEQTTTSLMDDGYGEGRGSGGGNRGGRDGTWKCARRINDIHPFSVYSIDIAPSVAGHGRIVSGGGDDRIVVHREEVCTSNGSGNSAKEGEGGVETEPTRFVTDVCVDNAHSGDVNCVRWHPKDGTRLASVGDDGMVKIWRYGIGG